MDFGMCQIPSDLDSDSESVTSLSISQHFPNNWQIPQHFRVFQSSGHLDTLQQVNQNLTYCNIDTRAEHATYEV